MHQETGPLFLSLEINYLIYIYYFYLRLYLLLVLCHLHFTLLKHWLSERLFLDEKLKWFST